MVQMPGEHKKMMRENLSPLLLAVFLPLLLSQCDVAPQKKNNISPVEQKIILTVAEQYPGPLTVQDPVISLSMRTEKTYGCINYHIAYDFFKVGNGLNFKIFGVEIGEICLPALGPATANEFLHVDDGAYSMRITLRDLYDDYSLTVTDTTILLVPLDTSVSRVNGRLHWRYPRKSFAYLAGTYTGDEALAPAFDDTLHKYLSLQEIKVPASGIWPYPPTSSGHYYDAPAKFYRYSNEADFDSAGALLKTFSKNILKYKQGAGFYIVNWRNKSYYSWLLE